MTNRLTCLLATVTLLAACGADNKTGNEPAVVDYAAEAQRIAQSSIIVDTHIDVPIEAGNDGPGCVTGNRQRRLSIIHARSRVV